MSETVVVTGVAGFIGSHQAEYLLEKGYTVVGIDNFHSYYSEEIKRNNLREIQGFADKSKGSFKFINGSILESEGLKELPVDPKWVFHLAALAGTRSSMNKPSEYSHINVQGTANLLEYFEEIEKFVYISSSSVYGELPEEKLPISEDHECCPKTPYALSKHNAERTVRLYSDLYDFDHAILRPFTVFGPRQRPDEVFTKFISMVLNDEPITIYGDGTQSRDFTFVEDAVRGIFQAAKKGNGTYNIGGQNRITVNKMVNTLDRLMDRTVEKKYLKEHPGDVSHTHADISKAREELGYQPKTGIEEGMRHCIRWTQKTLNKGETSYLKHSN